MEAAGPPILRIGFGIGATAKATGVESLSELLYMEPLVGREVDGRPSPHLAESWSWENEDRRVRLRLKDGVRFHNGAPLTADVAARALNKQLSDSRARGQAFETVSAITSRRP